MGIPFMASIHPFIERVNERSKGELTIKLLGGPEVIGEWDQPEAVRTGVVDLIMHYGDATRLLGAYATQYTYLTGPEQRETGLYDLVAEMFREQNIAYLGLGAGFGRLWMFTSVPATTPYDLSGHRFEGHPAWNEFLDALGISGVILPGEDLYAAMEQGLIEGFITNSSTVLFLSIYEVTDYLIYHPFYRTQNKFLLNLDSWNRLPPHLQQLLMDVVIELEPEQRDRDATLDEEWIQALFDAGMEPIEFSPADAKWFTDTAYDSMWEKILRVHPVRGPRLKELAGL